jgi:hypothetical protein
MRMPLLLAGWVLLMGLYYLVGVTLQVSLFNIAVPGLGASYSVFFSNVRLEFILVSGITSLVLWPFPSATANRSGLSQGKRQVERVRLQTHRRNGALCK